MMFRRSSRALSSLVLAEHANGKVLASTYSLLTAASKFNEPATVLVAGKGIGSVASSLASASGVSKVISVDDDIYEHGLPENLANLLVSIRKSGNFKRALAVHSALGKSVLPRAAAVEDVSMVSDIITVESPTKFTRPVYAGNAIATVESSQSVNYISVRATAFDKAAASGGSASVEKGSKADVFGETEFLEAAAPASDKPDLASARVVISGGRGLKSGDNFKILYDLADKIGNCAVGATRAVVDAGFVPNEIQVGQTGKIVAPELYIAVGLSGAIQHLAGMKDSKVIVCINTDEEAPIFSVSDYGLVADLFTAIPELQQKL
eukprot:NODE_2686_length_1061_cov_10.355731_g2239_i0.p2 GENE.NODE_2686_length_1061_cov_10.355731_g2239_i0~~NODE_2686_length_1061_cov_10.355731_g2239_i0.p2  ORF type:complete len:322 (+),score=86.66 NODE_2686_length_1061_cov_10.355731_g2239_i0:45-1010(+)